MGKRRRLGHAVIEVCRRRKEGTTEERREGEIRMHLKATGEQARLRWGNGP